MLDKKTHPTRLLYKCIVIIMVSFLAILNGVVLIKTPNDLMGVAFMCSGMSIVLMAFIYIKMAKSSFAKITIDSKGLAYFSGMNKIDWPWSEICDLNKTVFYRDVHNVNSREWKTSLRNKRLNKTIVLGSEFSENVHDDIGEYYARNLV